MTITPSPVQEALINAAIRAGLIRRAEDALDAGLRQLLDRIPAPDEGLFAEPTMKQTMFGDIPVFTAGKPIAVEAVQETIDAIRSERAEALTRES